MQRHFEDVLQAWNDEGPSSPLVVEGVRGCGKTHTVTEFAGRFDDFAYFDIAGDGITGIFDGRDARTVLSDLATLRDLPITGSTVVVLDGIQNVPGMAEFLAGAAEVHPRTIGICTGVGLYPGAARMWPLSFCEYLEAVGEPDLARCLRSDPLGTRVRDNHGRLMRLLKEHWAIGGLPAAVSVWAETHDERLVDREIRAVIDCINRDSAVLMPGAGTTPRSIMESIPHQLSGKNRKFMFGRAVEGARSKTLLQSITWLESQGVVHKTRISNSTSGPEEGPAPPNYKLYLFDTGAIRVIMGLPVSLFTADNQEVHDGMTENLVLLELLKSGITDQFCWRSGNKAEVSFVFGSGGAHYPIQVNSGRMAFARSLTEYVNHSRADTAFYLSPLPHSEDGALMRLPLYCASGLRAMVSRPRSSH